MGQALSLCSQNNPLHLLTTCLICAEHRAVREHETHPAQKGQVDTWGQPDTVGAGHCGTSGLQVLSWEASLKDRSRKDASGTLLEDHESPGHWVKVGAGTRAQTQSRGAESPPPSQGRLLPGVSSVHGDRRRIFRSQLQVPGGLSHWRLHQAPN